MKHKFWICAALVFAIGTSELPARAEITPEQHNALAAYQQQGEQLQQAGKWDDAIKDWSKLIELAATITDATPDFKARVVEAYQNRGLAYNETGAWEKAVADFNQALAIDPKNVNSLVGRGEADTHFGGMLSEVKTAPVALPLDDFNAAIAIDPHCARAYVERGKLSQGFMVIPDLLQKALPDYEKAVEVDPTYADGWYHRGLAKLFLDSDNRPAAKSDYDHAIALKPTAEYYQARAQLLENQRTPDYDAAVADYTAAIALDPENPSRYTNRARAQNARQTPDGNQLMADYSKAIDLLRNKLKALAPAAESDDGFDDSTLPTVDLCQALDARGDLQFKNGKMQEAFDDYNAALTAIPSDTTAIGGRAQILVAANQPQIAVDEVSARMADIRQNGNESLAVKMLWARGESFLMLQRWDEALIDLNQAIQTDSMPGFNIYSKNAKLYFDRAIAWQGKNDAAQAQENLNVAAGLDPTIAAQIKGTAFEQGLKPHAADKSVLVINADTAILHNLYGNEWIAAKSPANAINEFDKAVALDANNADAYNNRGQAWVALENFDGAAENFNKAIALKPDDPGFRLNRCDMYLRQQKPKDAIIDAKKATELQPANIAAWAMLATAQQLTGAYADMEVTLTAVLKLVGEDEKPAVRFRLMLARALQNKPLSPEDSTYLSTLSADKAALFLKACDNEAKQHPDVGALKALHDALVLRVNGNQA